jgi:hypothetical protein
MWKARKLYNNWNGGYGMGLKEQWPLVKIFPILPLIA